MKRLLISFLLFALAISSPVVAQSSTDAFPSSMLGFLEAGTHLGIQYSTKGPGDRDEHFVLQILDDEGWKIANDSRQLPLEELRKKYSVVDSFVSKRLLNYTELTKGRNLPQLPNGKQYTDPDISISVDRSTLLCTVLHVGDDYVLVSIGDDKKRRVLPKHLIKYMHWGDGLPNLSFQSKVIGATETKQSDANESR